MVKVIKFKAAERKIILYYLGGHSVKSYMFFIREKYGEIWLKQGKVYEDQGRN